MVDIRRTDASKPRIRPVAVATFFAGLAGLAGLVGLALQTGCRDEPSTPPDFKQVRSPAPHDEHPKIDGDELDTLVADNNDLTFALFHELRQTEASGKGFAISGHSLRSAFALLYGGAVGSAETEIASTLHFTLPPERQHVAQNWLAGELETRNIAASSSAGAVELDSANGVWILDALADKIEPAYLDLLAIDYDTGVALAAFDSNPEAERLALNRWVASRTANLIRELFSPGSITEDTSLLLVNALYVKAPWLTPFTKAATARLPFKRLDHSKVDVDMMRAFDLEAEYGEGPDYQAIAIPLRGQALELLVVLPTDYADFEASLDAKRLAAIREAMAPTVVITELPKLQLESNFELTTALRDLGMSAPFDDDHSFDGIVKLDMPGRGLGVISTVAHQTTLAIDEDGVEAAAATGVVVSVTSAAIPTASITVNRPFLVAIRDDPTGALLFFGRVLDPSQQP